MALSVDTRQVLITQVRWHPSVSVTSTATLVGPESIRFHGTVQAMPTHAWDALIGACAGAAAVMVSMPCDVVKTHLQTHARGKMGNLSTPQQMALFLSTGETPEELNGY